MTDSLKYHERRTMTYLNEHFPNDIQHFEKIQYLQSLLDSNIYDDYPDRKQALINVLNQLKEENRISILDSASEPDSEMSDSIINPES
jgi:hypothetical protein